MKCKALIVGTQNIKGTSKREGGKDFDFWKVNFIDTENPSGAAQSMTLPKDNKDYPIAELIHNFETNRMKVVNLDVYQNGEYTNFGGFSK